MARLVRRLRGIGAVLLAAGLAGAIVQAQGGLPSIAAGDLRTWLTYIASDQLQGRALYSRGLDLAADYIQDHLREWRVRPGGDQGSYLQTVTIVGVHSTSHSSVTVRVGGQSRTFADGHGITFPRNIGSKRRFTVDRVEFVGYGLDVPRAGHVDLTARDVKGAAAIWLGQEGPVGVDRAVYGRLLDGRPRHMLDELKAVATVGPVRENTRPAAAARSVDFTTSQRLDLPRAPAVGASDDFFEFLFSRAPTPYRELRALAQAREPMPSFTLDGVTLTFDLDHEYEVVRTDTAHNVVGIVEGSDVRLKDTYVALGAHYDHIGTAGGDGSDGRRSGAPGRVTAGAEHDTIWNGADDDGSGTVALMALARAYALGPRPKRSMIFVWHTGEERGLLGSRYFVDHPAVPLDQIVAQLNIDMIGRNRDNNPTESNTVYMVGADRISTELHDLSRAANRSLPEPLTLAYDFNDPSDVEQLYSRSDHYSYASKGIPIIFFTTALHPDYHANTDEVSRIEFPKMGRIVRLVYQIGWRLGTLEHALLHDERGARAGVGTE